MMTVSAQRRQRRDRRSFATLTMIVLLSATALSSSAAFAAPAKKKAAPTPAASSNAALEQRVQKLETLLEQLVQKLDGQDKASAQDAQTVRDAQAMIADMRRNQDEVKAKMAATETAVADVKKRSSADGFRVGKSTFKIGGYIKLDSNLTRYSGGDTASVAFGDDFYLPAQIPVGGASEGWDLNYNARETRIFITGETEVGNGHKLSGRVEFDFQAVATNADERATNGYSPELRHAWIQYDDWLFGQTWTLFQNVNSLPESIEFIGPTEGTVFVRQPQIRYVKGKFGFAVEEPETVLTSRTGAQVTSNDGGMPDITARYMEKGKWGEFTLAGVVRRIQCDLCIAGINDSATGWGVSAAGLIKLGAKDDLRFMASGGRGIGRYLGVNIVNDAAVRLDGTLQPIGVYNGFVAYRHVWRDGLRSSLYGAYFRADNPVVNTGFGQTDRIWSVHANLLWSPVPPLTIGLEGMYAERRLESGLDGNMTKLQLSTKYAF
jgi:hypothetical protein